MTGRQQEDAGRTERRACLSQIYDELWWRAIPQIRCGKVELDPVLAAGQVDQRRGLTLIARPPEEVKERVMEFARELWDIEPEQYYYSAAELHITVLSLFTATVEHQPLLARTAEYVSAVNNTLLRRDWNQLSLEFRGVSASGGTVMIQGFFDEPDLNVLREGLRQELRTRGLGTCLDSRYRLQAAHMTFVRFRSPLKQPELFSTALETARDRWFGKTSIGRLTLVENDWYMSQTNLRTLKEWS